MEKLPLFLHDSTWKYEAFHTLGVVNRQMSAERYDVMSIQVSLSCDILGYFQRKFLTSFTLNLEYVRANILKISLEDVSDLFI